MCAIDDSSSAFEAAAAAIDLCRNTGDLRLVGVVRPGGAVQPGYGESLRRRRQVEHALREAAKDARRAGLEPDLAIGVGKPIDVLVREADAAETNDALLVHTPGIIGRTLTRKPHVRVLRYTREEARAPTEQPRLQQAA
jgi:hypothetical protein